MKVGKMGYLEGKGKGRDRKVKDKEKSRKMKVQNMRSQRLEKDERDKKEKVGCKDIYKHSKLEIWRKAFNRLNKLLNLHLGPKQ